MAAGCGPTEPTCGSKGNEDVIWTDCARCVNPGQGGGVINPDQPGVEDDSIVRSRRARQQRFARRPVNPRTGQHDLRLAADRYRTEFGAGKHHVYHNSQWDLDWDDKKGCTLCSEMDERVANHINAVNSLTVGLPTAANDPYVNAMQVEKAVQVTQAVSMLDKPQLGNDYIRGDVDVCISKSEHDHTYTRQQLELAMNSNVGFFAPRNN